MHLTVEQDGRVRLPVEVLKKISNKKHFGVKIYPKTNRIIVASRENTPMQHGVHWLHRDGDGRLRLPRRIAGAFWTPEYSLEVKKDRLVMKPTFLLDVSTQ